MPVLHALAARSGHPVRLVIGDGTDALCVELVCRNSRPDPSSAPGCRLPLHATAVGKVLLAYGEKTQLRSVLQSPSHRFTPYTLPPDLLMRALAGIRAGEVAQAKQEHRLGEYELAVPVLRPDGEVAALGMLCGATDRSRVGAAALLRSASAELTRTLASYPGRATVTAAVTAH